jgi:hypothetical protein
VADSKISKNAIHPILTYGMSAVAGAVVTAIMFWNEGITLILIGVPLGAGFVALAVDLMIYWMRGQK